MQKFKRIFCYVFFIVSSTQSYCQINNSIIQLTYKGDYSSANKIIKELKTEDPNSLPLNYFEAMIIWRQRLNLGNVVTQKKESKKTFVEKLSFVIEEGGLALQENEKDSIALFYVGAAYGFLAQYNALVNESYFKAAGLGKSGLNIHEKLLFYYPQTYDAYYSIGLFNYLSSNVPWYLKPVLFILGKSGSEANAYDFLTKVSINGNMAKYEAMETLAELQTSNGQYKKADSLYKKLKSLFPNNINYYNYKYLKQLYSMGDDSTFIKVANEAIGQSKLQQIYNGYQQLHLFLVYATITLKYENLNEVNIAIDVYSEIIGMEKVNDNMKFSLLFSRGKLYELSGQTSKAINDYKTAIRITNNQSFKNAVSIRLNKLKKE